MADADRRPRDRRRAPPTRSTRPGLAALAASDRARRPAARRAPRTRRSPVRRSRAARCRRPATSRSRVDGARAAQRAWARATVAERAAVLLRLHDLVLDRQDDLLDLIQLETGKARRHAFEEIADVAIVRAPLRPAGAVATCARRRHPGLAPVLSSAHELRHPKGVVGIVSPWNYPLTLAVSDALPALLAGNAVVLQARPADGADRAVGASAGREAGLPEALLQVVLGDGPAIGGRSSTAATTSASPGSTRVGREVAEQCARRLVGARSSSAARTRCTSPADADLDRAAEGAVRACFATPASCASRWSGSTSCTGAHDEFVDRFVRRVTGLRARHRARLPGRHGLADLRGPARHGSRRTSTTRSPRARRCSPVAAPGPTSGRCSTSRRARPASPRTMRLCREETFGPVVAVREVADDDGGGPAGQRHGVRAQRDGVDARRRERSPHRRPDQGRHRQHQRDLRRGLGQRPGCRWAAEGQRTRTAARSRGHPEVHRAADPSLSNDCSASARRRDVTQEAWAQGFTAALRAAQGGRPAVSSCRSRAGRGRTTSSSSAPGSAARSPRCG